MAEPVSPCSAQAWSRDAGAHVGFNDWFWQCGHTRYLVCASLLRCSETSGIGQKQTLGGRRRQQMRILHRVSMLGVSHVFVSA